MSKPSVNCAQVKRLLPPLLDEELSGGERETVSTHLASCPTCRAELASLKTDLGLLEQVVAPEVSPFLVTRVMAEIRHSARSGAKSKSFGVRFWRLIGSVAAALVVAVSIGAGVFLGSGLAQASTETASDSTEAAVSYVESSNTSMYSLMWGGQ
ncbi:MAG TPA: zf-HC2 domain-containing protein [bacterium]|nr:zf-HC2 domain-containing protein [bacterium]